MKNKILTTILSVVLVFTLVLSPFNVYANENINIGDTNGDEKITLDDVVILAQYVADWDVVLQSISHADTTGDGEIDLVDVNYLAQYVAGWDVEFGTAPIVPQPPEEEGVNFNNANEAEYLKTLPTRASVSILMWRKWNASEQKLINDYMLKTGVKINTTVTTESEYPTKLVSMVSSGNSPDIIRFSANHFPGLITKALQTLDETKFHLDADCWNKKYMDAYKVNGKYFGVAMSKTWECEDQNYVTYYSPKLLKECGITTTPYQHYKQGTWNWDTEAEIIRKVKSSGIAGLMLQSYDAFMHSAGTDFACYANSQFANNLGEVAAGDLLSQAWMHASELKSDDCFAGWDLNAFSQGRVGLFTAISYGLCNEGNWFRPEFANTLEAVPVAGPKGKVAYTPAKPSCWGLPKKAPNPDGAAYFLRYFLDVSNYDHDNTFHSDQFKEVFEIVTSDSRKQSIMYGSGVSDYVESGTYSQLCNLLVATTPYNIAAQLNARKGRIQTGLSRANKDLARIN